MSTTECSKAGRALGSCRASQRINGIPTDTYCSAAGKLLNECKKIDADDDSDDSDEETIEIEFTDEDEEEEEDDDEDDDTIGSYSTGGPSVLDEYFDD